MVMETFHWPQTKKGVDICRFAGQRTSHSPNLVYFHHHFFVSKQHTILEHSSVTKLTNSHFIVSQISVQAFVVLHNDQDCQVGNRDYFIRRFFICLGKQFND